MSPSTPHQVSFLVRNLHPVTGIPGKAYSFPLFMLRNALPFSCPHPLPLSGLASLASENILFFFIAFNVNTIAWDISLVKKIFGD